MLAFLPSLRAVARRPVFLNAASLWGTTLITSVLGFGFWIAAARLFPIDSVGIASAAISAMMLLAQFGLLGMGTLLIGELAGGEFTAGLVSAATLLAGGVSFGLGLAFVALQGVVSTKLGPLGHGVVGPLLFASGTGITAVTLVMDQACIGLNRGGLQLARNAIFSLAKFVLLPVGALLANGPWSEVMYASWTAGNVFSLITFWFHVRRSGIRPVLAPAFQPLYAVRKAAFSHHWLNLANQVRPLLLPVIVSATLLSSSTAAFYEANLIVSFVAIIPAHLSTALFALPRGSFDRLAKELRATLRLSFGVSVLAAVFFAALAYPILLVFGHSYVVAANSMRLLGVSAIPFTVQAHYAAVERVHGRLMRCAGVFTACALFEIALCIVGVKEDGLTGVSAGLDISLGLEALMLWPTVARAAQVPVLGIPSWLWRFGAEDEAIGSSPVGALIAPETSPPAETHAPRTAVASGVVSALESDPAAVALGSSSQSVLRPGDPAFVRLTQARASVAAGSLLARLRARLTMARLTFWVVRRRRQLPHERLHFSSGPTGDALAGLMTFPAAPFVAPRWLLARLDLSGVDADLPMTTKVEGVRIVQLPNPATAFAALALAGGRTPMQLEQEEPEIRPLLDLSSAVLVVAVDRDDAFLCAAFAVSDGEDGYLVRLVSDFSPATQTPMTVVHAYVCSLLKRAGVTRVWSDGPLTADLQIQQFQSVTGYRCATFEIGAPDG